MGGENPIGAAVHDGCPSSARCGRGWRNRYQVEAGLQARPAPVSCPPLAWATAAAPRPRPRRPSILNRSLTANSLAFARGGPGIARPAGHHGPHRFQSPAFPRHRRQRAHAAHRPHAAARLRRARRLRGRGRRGRPRRLHPLRAGYRADRLGDADLRRPRADADDPPARRQRQSVRADHHDHRPHREGARHRRARRRRHRIPGQADLGQGALSAHRQRGRQPAAVHQDQDLFRPGPPAQRQRRPTSAPSAARAARPTSSASRRCSTRPRLLA